MCSAADDPTTYDAPTPQPPRRYVLSGDAPAREPASVALAVLGEMLTDAERDYGQLYPPPYSWEVDARLRALREARDRVAAAEAALR